MTTTGFVGTVGAGFSAPGRSPVRRGATNSLDWGRFPFTMLPQTSQPTGPAILANGDGAGFAPIEFAFSAACGPVPASSPQHHATCASTENPGAVRRPSVSRPQTTGTVAWPFSFRQRRGWWTGHNNLRRILGLIRPLCRTLGETVVFVRHLDLNSPVQWVLGPLRSLVRFLRSQTPMSRIG